MDTTVPQPREQLSRILERRIDVIVNDALAVFPFAGIDSLDTDRGVELGALALQLLTSATREGELDPRSDRVAEALRLMAENGLSVSQLFSFIYLIERAAVDEIALDDSFGASSEPWPAVSQMVRRASVDVLGAIADRLGRESGPRALQDPLTRLHTRGVLMAALDKEVQRSERFGHPFALILVDVDRFAEINRSHGYGVGDRVLERIGILITNFFRGQDWVSRQGDRFAVLLPETQPAAAASLAERLRLTVQERLGLRDHETGQPQDVTVSVALLVAESIEASAGADTLLKQASDAVARAKQAGRNRVERFDINVTRPEPQRRTKIS